MAVRETVDVPASRIVTITDESFTITVGKVFGSEQRRFPYLDFARVGGPISKEPLLIGQITDYGTLLRLFADEKVDRGLHAEQVEKIMLIAKHIAMAVAAKQRASADLISGELSDDERRALDKKFGGTN